MWLTLNSRESRLWNYGEYYSKWLLLIWLLHINRKESYWGWKALPTFRLKSNHQQGFPISKLESENSPEHYSVVTPLTIVLISRTSAHGFKIVSLILQPKLHWKYSQYWGWSFPWSASLLPSSPGFFFSELNGSSHKSLSCIFWSAICLAIVLWVLNWH